MRVKTKHRYVLGFAFHGEPAERTVVLLEKRTPEWQRGRLNGVGGKIEAGETPVEAMIREFEEEVGVKTSPRAWQLYVRMHGEDWECHVFRANLNNEQAKEVKRTEAEQPVFVRVDDIPLNTLKNVRYLIGMADHADIGYVTISYNSTGD